MTSSSSRARSTRCGSTGPRCSSSYARHVETGEPLPAEVIDEAGRLRDLQPGLRDERVPGSIVARSGLALAHRRGGRGRDRCRRIRGIRSRRYRPRQPRRAHPLLVDVLRARVLGRVQRGLLLLHLERGARRGHRRVVSRERRPHARERRTVPRAPARRRRLEGPPRGLPRLPRAGCRDRPAAEAPRSRRSDRGTPRRGLAAQLRRSHRPR